MEFCINYLILSIRWLIKLHYMSLKKIISPFYQFTTYPTHRLTVKEKCVVLLKGLLISIAGFTLAFWIINFILIFCGAFGFPIRNVLHSKNFTDNIHAHILDGLFLMSVLGPLLEESIFRLWLSNTYIYKFIHCILHFNWYLYSFRKANILTWTG